MTCTGKAATGEHGGGPRPHRGIDHRHVERFILDANVFAAAKNPWGCWCMTGDSGFISDDSSCFYLLPFERSTTPYPSPDPLRREGDDNLLSEGLRGPFMGYK